MTGNRRLKSDWNTGEGARKKRLQSPLPPMEEDQAAIMSTEEQRWRNTDFYVCPRGSRVRMLVNKCGGADMFFCTAWDCVSMGTIAWKPPVNDDLITVTRVPQQLASNLWYGRCPGFLSNPIQVSFTGKGKKFQDWKAGYS